MGDSFMDNKKISIRPSIKEDFNELVYIDNVIWNNQNGPISIQWESVEDYARSCPAGSQFVAIYTGEVAGYISYKPPTPLISNSHVIEIAIGVHPAFQGKGIGKTLMEFISVWAGKNNIRKISLRVLSTNTGAINFYKSIGYIEQGRLIDEFVIDGKYVDDIMMYKIIEPK
jgi:RimJ/RimL family protein N-acetyltransferase